MDSEDKPVDLPKVGDGASAATAPSSVPADATAQPQHPGSSQLSNPIAANIPVPDEAADSDLIEKEWVERAKQIVEHTKDDPHEQQRAVSQMKADYLKKRYNKDINAVSD